jgi:alkylmercury lyase
MEKQTVNDLADQFISEIGSDSYSQFAKILGLLANGRPVAVDEVAKELDMYPEQAKKFLTSYGAEFDSAGNLLGLGLTLVPTPHQFEVDGHKLYAWCATDTLLFPILLNKTANVQTIDPVTGTKIRLTVSPRAVERVEPSGAVLSFSNYLDATDVRGTFCNIGHWFASRQTGEEYASKHKGVIILTPGEVRGILNVVGEKTTGRPEQKEEPGCGADYESKAPSCH